MASTRPDAWMPLWWGDYARDTGHLGAVHHGAYLMLIKHYWVTGQPIPADDAQLWRLACADSLAHWRKIKAVVLAFFEERDGLLHHARIEEELVNAATNADRRAEMARKAANARWGKDAQGNALRMPNAKLPECPSSPPSSNSSQGEIVTGPPRAPAPNGARAGTTSVNHNDDVLWRARLRGYRVGGRWHGDYGPRPETGQCYAPKHILDEWLEAQPKAEAA